MTTTQNLENYREMSEPFLSAEKANENIQAFYEEVGRLRKKYKLPDVYVIIQMNYINQEGSEGRAVTTAHFGNSAEAATMCAWAYGREKSIQQMRLDAIVAENERGSAVTAV